MTNSLPSKTFIAEAVPAGDGYYYALFSAPGLIPRLSGDDKPTPLKFPTTREAEEEARRALFGILQRSRRQISKRNKHDIYKRLTADEFAVELAKANIEPHLFAFIYGTSARRVFSWLDGTDDIPHPVRVLLALFQFDEANIDIAENVTHKVTELRKPRRLETG